MGTMSSSGSDSEEVLIKRANKPGTNMRSSQNTPIQLYTQTHPIRADQSSPMDMSGNSHVSPINSFEEEWGVGSKDAQARQSSNAIKPALRQRKPPVKLKENPYAPPPPEVLEELKRLQKPIILKAHQNRAKEIDLPTASPEFVAKARDGPGTERNSEISRQVDKIRQVPVTVSNVAPVPTPSTILSDSDQGSEVQRYLAQWKAYKVDPRLFSRVEDGKLILSTTPGPGQDYEEPPSTVQASLESKQHTGNESAAENRWGGSVIVDWEYRPRMCSNYAAFRDWFRVWLDTTISSPATADVYHQSFFDGTAHADGAGSLFIGDFEHKPTILDPDDEETCLHAHETVAGYNHNIEIHIKRQEDEEVSRQRRAREAYIEGMRKVKPNPYIPKANIYLRPAQLGDASELVKLFNWYMENSPVSSDNAIVSQDDARERIQLCRSQYLPFIVAVERKTPHHHHDAAVSMSEKVMGYALARDHMCKNSSARYTANLQLFVRADSKEKGVGRCLMDKLLEVCDPTFKSKQGYYFDTGNEDHMGYYPGGGRRLSRLIFTVSYPDNDRASYEWVIDWLKRFDFEEQGVLKGVRVKFQRHLDVSYLVRNVAFSTGGAVPDD